MPHEITITQISDLEPTLEALLDNIGETVLLHTTGDRLDISIKLKGESWDGCVDVRVARFVTELQKSVDRCRSQAGLDGDSQSLVKVQVKNGSTEIATDLFQLIKDLSANLSPAQTMVIALTLIGCGFLGWSLKVVLAHIESKHAATVDSEEKKELLGTLKLALNQLDPEKAPRTLISNMSKEDTIALQAYDHPLTREEAREKYPRKRRVTPSDLKIDDNYLIGSISLEGSVRLTLSRHEIEFKAELSESIPEADKDAFLVKVRAAIDTHSTLRMALHIDGRVGDKIHSAKIVGIDKPPREGAISLEDLLD